MLSRLVTSSARRSVASFSSVQVGWSHQRVVAKPPLEVSTRLFSGYSDSITYSGGQASEGQGGFYGSGGARVSKLETEHKPEMMALASDVENLTLVMEEVYKLEDLLEEEKEKSGVSGKSLEISSKIKKIMTSMDVMDCLNRLEIDGEPVWGLSSSERELVHYARQKVNEC
eukprot:scaffold5185_cov198-Alexandrium_tamarense.AAC.15